MTNFNPAFGLIVVVARIHGPRGEAYVRLALDTGATMTVVRTAPLVSVGLDPAASGQRVHVTTGSGTEYAPQVSLERIEAIGRERRGFHVLAHTMPASTGVDGVLGLDFLRGGRLTIDFRKGRISLT